MNWREGTETMTSEEFLKWEIYEGGIHLMLGPEDFAAYGAVLNRQQALDMICGLAALIAQMED